MTASLVECPEHTGHAPSIEIQGGRPLKAFDQVERMELILGACEPLDLIHVQPERFGLSTSCSWDGRPYRSQGMQWTAKFSPIRTSMLDWGGLLAGEVASWLVTPPSTGSIASTRLLESERTQPLRPWLLWTLDSRAPVCFSKTNITMSLR